MELKEFFQPAGITLQRSIYGQLYNTLFINKDSQDFDFYADYDLAIIGIQDLRESRYPGGDSNVQEIRKEFYRLHDHGFNLKVADFGNLITGKDLSDTLFAIKIITTTLVQKGVIPVFIGGGQHFTYPIYAAISELTQLTNLLVIDAMFDIGNEADENLNSSNFLSKIITHQPSSLFNYTNLGYQTYMVSSEELELMEKLNFDYIRVGLLRQNFADIEPYIRSAEIVSVDPLSIRNSDFQSSQQSPHGLHGEEFCQLMLFTGLSDNLKVLGFFETHNEQNCPQNNRLLAHGLWHVLLGLKNKIKEKPYQNRKNFQKYLVCFDIGELVFYKNKHSEKWWMEVKYPDKNEEIGNKTLLIPCSESDYLMALNHEIPPRWLKFYNKII
ncbi:MAG: arginase [Vicingaceae bacterium]|nr:MAG: arginase [Vicingaceae bacterium]